MDSRFNLCTYWKGFSGKKKTYDVGMDITVSVFFFACQVFTFTNLKENHCSIFRSYSKALQVSVIEEILH